MTTRTNENTRTRTADRPQHIAADLAVICPDDSMIGAGIRAGDIAYIRREAVRSGQIAAVVLEESATLRRVYFQDDTITLRADNPSYPPQVFTGEAAALALHIIGRAVAYTHEIP